MSYILDALRRADAERERDPARGIHAQPAAGAPVRRGASVPAWAWPALGAVLVAGAAAAWLQRPAAVPPSPLPARTLAPVPPPVVLPVATTVTPPPPVAAAAPAATSISPAAPPMPAPAEKPRVPVALSHPAVAPTPAPGAAAAKPAVPASAAAVPALPVPAGAAAPAPAAVPAPAAAQAADRVYNVAELPADVQQGLPKLAISGGVYSDNVAQRMLVVGGQVVSEGAELAPGVVLDQIRARTAVLRFRGYRYSVPY